MASHARRPETAVQPQKGDYSQVCGARAASSRPASWSESDRTIEFVALANEAIERKTWDGVTFREVLPLATGRFDRLNGRANLFISDSPSGAHVRGATQAIGVIESYRVEPGVGLVVSARLSDALGDADHVRKVATGILPSVSLDYDVDDWIETRGDDGIPVITATGWDALGLNVVGVPADSGAHSRARGARSMNENAKKIMQAIVAQAGDSMALEKVYKTVGKDADLDPTTVGAIAKGEQEATPEELAALAKALGLTFTVALVEGKPESEEPEVPEFQDQSPAPAPAGEMTMQTPVAPERAIADERARSAEITTLCAKHGRSQDAGQFIASGATVDAVRADILDKLATADAATGTRGHVQVVADATDKRRADFENAILARSGVAKLEDSAKRFRGRSLVEASRLFLIEGGMRDANELSNTEVARIALGGRAAGMVSADLPQLLENIGNKSLLAGFADYQPIYQRIAQKVDTSNFNPINAVLASTFPTLLEVPEGADYQPGSISDSKNSFTPKRYARKIRFSVEMLTKDDLSGLTRAPQTYGGILQSNRDSLAIGVITANANLSDAVALFAAGHSNVAAGTDVDPPSVASFSGMRKILATQTNSDGLVMGLQPVIALVPYALLDATQQIVAGNFMPTSAGSATLPWMRNIEVLAHGALDTADPKAWYFLADPSRSPVLQWCEVAGHGPMLDSRYDWDSDCLEFKVVDSFGVGAVDYRGGVYNAGT